MIQRCDIAFAVRLQGSIYHCLVCAFNVLPGERNRHTYMEWEVQVILSWNTCTAAWSGIVSHNCVIMYVGDTHYYYYYWRECNLAIILWFAKPPNQTERVTNTHMLMITYTFNTRHTIATHTNWKSSQKVKMGIFISQESRFLPSVTFLSFPLNLNSQLRMTFTLSHKESHNLLNYFQVLYILATYLVCVIHVGG